MSTRIPFGKPEKVQPLRLLDGSQLEIASRSIEFRLWIPLLKRWGKNVIDVNGEQMCAETAVVQLFLDHGWEAVWVSSKRYRRDFPPDHCELSEEAETELLKVRGHNLRGCWDVFAFKEGSVLFVECKGKDGFIDSQREWIAAALRPETGFTLENFVVLHCRKRTS
jgi:hypothetical protein